MNTSYLLCIVLLPLVIDLPSWATLGLDASNVTEPFIYTKLRFERNFLQIYRRFQRYMSAQETKKQVELIETLNSNKTRSINITYYENDQIETTNFTQDFLIFEALDRAYKTRLLPVYLYNYDNKEDLDKASDPNIVSQSRCLRDLAFLMSQLDEVQISRARDTLMISVQPELAAFFDSYAGEEPGLLLGNYHWTGNWNQCKKRQIFHLDRSNASRSINFNGRYCIASLKSKTWGPWIKERTEELLENYFKYPEQRYDYARFFRLQVGICLPDSCDSRIINERRDDIQKLAVHKLSYPLRSYDLADLFCLPDDTSELRQLEPSGRLFIWVALLWISMVIMSTIYDWCYPKEVATVRHSADSTIQLKLVYSLSMIQNIGRLIETKSLQPPASKNQASSKIETSQQETQGKVKVITMPKLIPKDLLFLNAIKVISMPLIIFGHVGMLFKHMDRYVLDFEGLRSDVGFHFQASTPFFVDFYFVITGFLTTYLMFIANKVERNTMRDWIYHMFHRYWRLAPLYLIAFWFTRSVFMQTNSGPVWDYGTQNMTLRAICRRESWLWPITLTSNFHPLHEECIMPAWYISCDMQFYMITPFILILLSKMPLLGWLASLGTIGACISLRLHRYLTDPRAQHLELMRPRYDLYMRNNWDMHATYVYPQYRISTYLIGILAGHYTYMVSSGQWASIVYSPKWHSLGKLNSNRSSSTRRGGQFKWFLRLAAWVFGVYLISIMMFATWIISELFPVAWEPHVKYFTSAIYAFDHAAAGLGMALVLVTMMLDQFKGLKWFLSLPFWSVISRVNYVVFLIQVEIIYWLLQSAYAPLGLCPIEILKVNIAATSICYSLATILTVLLELPLAQLEREFVGKLINGHWLANHQSQHQNNHNHEQPDSRLSPEAVHLSANSTGSSRAS